MLSTTLLGALCTFASVALAQKTSITSTPSMVPMLSPSAPPVTMAWDDKPTAAAAQASSLNSALQSAITSMSMEAGMTMSDGSVMPMSATSSMPSGTAMAGMDMTAAAGRVEAAAGVWSVGMVGAGIALGVSVVVGML